MSPEQFIDFLLSHCEANIKMCGSLSISDAEHNSIYEEIKAMIDIYNEKYKERAV